MLLHSLLMYSMENMTIIQSVGWCLQSCSFLGLFLMSFEHPYVMALEVTSEGLLWWMQIALALLLAVVFDLVLVRLIQLFESEKEV